LVYGVTEEGELGDGVDEVEGVMLADATPRLSRPVPARAK
jgi:hypothetical protein